MPLPPFPCKIAAPHPCHSWIVSAPLPARSCPCPGAGHANCILRAGTPEVVLIDHDDFHWTLLTEDEHTHVVQLARAKELVGELLVFPAEIAYVQVEPTETDGRGKTVLDAATSDWIRELLT